MVISAIERLKRRQMAVKQISTASEDIPITTSDSDPIHEPTKPSKPLEIVNRQIVKLARTESSRSLASQVNCLSLLLCLCLFIILIIAPFPASEDIRGQSEVRSTVFPYFSFFHFSLSIIVTKFTVDWIRTAHTSEPQPLCLFIMSFYDRVSFPSAFVPQILSLMVS